MPRNLGRRVSRAWGAAAVLAAALVGGGAAAGHAAASPAPSEAKQIDLSAASLADLGQLESSLGRWDRAMVAVEEALLLDRQYGSPFAVAVGQSTLALSTLRAGRPREARDLVCDLFDYVASSGNTAFFLNTLELAAVIAGALDEIPLAARLLGAAQTIRRESGMQLTQPEAALLDELLAPARASVTPQEWDTEEAAGRALSQPEALTLLRSLSPA